MKSSPNIFILVLTLSTQAWSDDATDVRAAIERHYQAINAQQEGEALSQHLETFTMFPGDGGLLFEPGWAQLQERLGQNSPFPDLDVRITHFRAELYGNVAVATFYLVGTQTAGGMSSPLNNRVTAVWIKQNGSWTEAHHHESPLLGRN